MSDTLEILHRKIQIARDLASVVRAMKAMAASNIGLYQAAVCSLGDYYRTVELGLVACFRQTPATPIPLAPLAKDENVAAVVFGSDQGLVGQFNEVLAEFVSRLLQGSIGKNRIWVIGERLQGRLADAGMVAQSIFPVPNSVGGITPLIGRVLVECDAELKGGSLSLYVCHNRPTSGAGYQPVSQRLLPLDQQWRQNLLAIDWPGKNLPQVLSAGGATLHALLREYLFASLFKACAESLASENASRLSAMQRAEKNIGERMEDLTRSFHRLRQTTIDEELFDVISGFESFPGATPGR